MALDIRDGFLGCFMRNLGGRVVIATLEVLYTQDLSGGETYSLLLLSRVNTGTKRSDGDVI